MVMPTIDQNKAGEHPQGSAPFASRSDLAACSLVPRAIKMGSPLNTGAACVYLLLNKTILKTQQLFKQGRKKARLHQLWCLLQKSETCILMIPLYTVYNCLRDILVTSQFHYVLQLLHICDQLSDKMHEVEDRDEQRRGGADRRLPIC